jgi:methionine sulfoxide reductase heme-binding subunit
VTPLRFVTRFNRLILVRRALGLAALFYTLGHIVLWCVDENYQWATILWELILRMFLTVGLASTLILVALGVTSNDWGIRTLGAKNWNRLHAWTYAATGLGVLHYFMVTEAVLLAGLFMLAMAFRVARRWLRPQFLPLIVAAAICAALTAAIEAFYYSVSTRVSVERVLLANLDFSYSIRPAWWVFGVGVVVACGSFVRQLSGPPSQRKR